MANDVQGARLIRLPAVIARAGLSRSAIYVRIQRDEFPRPVALGVGQAVAWVESEVDAWVASQIARRDAGQHEAHAAAVA
jgi:prophage regulatory protein